MKKEIKEFEKKIKEFEKKIKEANLISEKEFIRSEMKTYVYSLSDEEYQIYRKNALAEMNKEAQVIDKLLEAYELMKNNMLTYS